MIGLILPLHIGSLGATVAVVAVSILVGRARDAGIAVGDTRDAGRAVGRARDAGRATGDSRDG